MRTIFLLYEVIKNSSFLIGFRQKIVYIINKLGGAKLLPTSIM
ncbi:hypothetical protein SSUR61_1472 [Streptococcus suis R61]|uniref:Uncharacterized protein n=1 Tax=Streptococcus suis R61 TaxID=996306 RepID=A0AA87F8R5_STRSU|nr:hypothetical protein SSUR61_1472 [Streptococcus suis R61]